MRSKPRPHLDLWSLLAIYAAAATLMIEASYQLPLAVLDACGRPGRA